jgi:hypothetical protein
LRRYRRRRLSVLAERVSWASEQIADKYGTFVIPKVARDYIGLVVRKVGYRSRIRAEVRQELEGYFHDALGSIADKQERLDRAAAIVKDFGDARVLAKLIRRGKKRCRPLWLKALIRCVQAVGIAIIVFIAYIGWMFTGRPYISVDYVAELNKMVKPTADESLNGEPYYGKAASLLTPEPNGLPRPWEAELTPEQVAVVRQWVAECAPAAEQVCKGNERPYAWQNYISSNGSMISVTMPGLADRKQLIYLMGWTAWVNAQDGKFDRALDDIRQCYLIGQHMEKKDLFVEQLVAQAIKSYAAKVARAIIAQPGVRAESLARFQADYEGLLAQSDFQLSYATESMFTKDIVQRVFARNGHILPWTMAKLLRGLPGPSAPRGDFGDVISGSYEVILGSYMVLTCPDRAKTMEQANGFYDKAEQMELIMPYKARTLHPTLSEYGNQIMSVNPVLREILPADERAVATSWQGYANCHALVAQIAAERYKRDKGTYPESLEELQKAGYLKELPMDPWSDKPLVYRKTADGYTLYSVGMNFTDDGGKGLDEKGKLIRWSDTDKGGDIVFWPMPRDGGDKK